MATNPEFRRTLLIGLGGAGQQIVLRTKRFFLDTFGVLPPSIKVLCLDTDDEELKMRSATQNREYRIDAQEFLHLAVGEPSKYIESTPDVQRWYVKPVPVGAINRGAGAVRQNGRLALFYHIVEIRRRIDDLLSALNDPQLEAAMNNARVQLGSTRNFELSHRDTEIYLCGSIAGGTGSGTFLDMGLLFRDQCPNALIHGFFLMPWVYRNKAFAYRVFQNAYAALAELDNLQSIMYGQKQFVPYQVRYGSHTVTANKAPFDLFNVIDGRNEYGQNIDDVQALCETIANALFLSIGAMSYKVASVTDNLLSHIGVASPRVWDGRYARYSSLGVSSIHYPALELHRLLGAQNALRLCSTALNHLESGQDAAAAATTVQRVTQDADSFINQLNLYRPNVRAQVCPDQAAVALPMPPNFMIADAGFPQLLQANIQGVQKTLEQSLAGAFAASGRKFIDGLLESIERRLKALVEDPHLDSASRRAWSAHLAGHLRGLLDETAQERVKADALFDGSRQSAQKLLAIATNSRYLPIVGGARKTPALAWITAVSTQLTALKQQINLDHEQQCYETLLKRVEAAANIAVPNPSDIAKALIEAETELRRVVTKEEGNLEILRKRPNHVLLGYGNTVVIPNLAKGQSFEAFALAYEAFTAEVGIHTAEDYLRRHQQGSGKLAALFNDYCLNKLADLTQVTVDGVLETLARDSDHPQDFEARQFDHLFRLSGALWSYEQGQITPDRAEQMDKIINLGFYDHEADVPKYESLAEAAKSRFHIRSDLAYSTTGDPYHIWMLNYAAALPAYFLKGLREAREAYHEQITPSYHVDAYFEMNVPDLFPVGELDNQVLRVLTMAIVSGIDVIRDEKLTKGHKFTWDDPEVRTRNFDDPMVWLLFRDMYAEFKDGYNARRTDNLFDLLIQQVRDKIAALDPRDLTACIQNHIDKFSKKLEQRDFSRLISARLTYREIRALGDFLKNYPGGYGRNLERYLNGDLG